MTCGRSAVVRMPGSAAHTTATALTARLAVKPGRRLAHALERHGEAQVDVERGVAVDA